jgi:hypothetical protein
MQSVTSNAVAKANSYSTSETFTGKYWIDGKKIYKNYVTIENVVRGQYTDSYMPDIDSIIIYGGEFWADNTKYLVPCRWLGVYNEPPNIKLYNYDLGTGILRMWIEYTKTTD